MIYRAFRSISFVGGIWFTNLSLMESTIICPEKNDWNLWKNKLSMPLLIFSVEQYISMYWMTDRLKFMSVRNCFRSVEQEMLIIGWSIGSKVMNWFVAVAEYLFLLGELFGRMFSVLINRYFRSILIIHWYIERLKFVVIHILYRPIKNTVKKLCILWNMAISVISMYLLLYHHTYILLLW